MLPLPAGRGARSGVGATEYERHRPECTLLYQLIEEYYPAFESHLAAQGMALPDYIRQEFTGFSSSIRRSLRAVRWSVLPLLRLWHPHQFRHPRRHPRPPRHCLSAPRPLWSLGLLIMILRALNETSAEEFQDHDLMLGYLVFVVIAGVLAWLALGDVKQQRARGKALAITDLVFAILIALSAFGWLIDMNPVPVTASSDMESLVQAKIHDAQTHDGSEDSVAAVAPIVTSAPSAASINPPAAVALAGKYVLRDITVGGMPVDLNGALSISRTDSDTYHWQSHYAGQGPEGVETESYSGQFLRREGLWYQRVAESDAADWDAPEEVPMQLIHAGTNLQLRYNNGGAEIVTTWQRDVE